MAWGLQTDAQRGAIAYDERRIDSLTAEVEVLQDRKRQLLAIMDSEPVDSDKWHDAAGEYDALGDAVGDLMMRVQAIENTKGMP